MMGRILIQDHDQTKTVSINLGDTFAVVTLGVRL